MSAGFKCLVCGTYFPVGHGGRLYCTPCAHAMTYARAVFRNVRRTRRVSEDEVRVEALRYRLRKALERKQERGKRG